MQSPVLSFGIIIMVFGALPGYSFQEPGSSDSERVRSISVEVGGPAAEYYSVHYDTRFRGSSKWGIRTGGTFVPRGMQRVVSFPVQLHHLWGKKRHFFEAGAGATLYYTNFEGSTWGVDSNAGASVFGTLTMAYRFEPPAKGVTFRAGVTGGYGQFLPFVLPCVSVGFRF